MKILHIPNYYHPHIGGIEQVCRDVVRSCGGTYEQQIVCFNGGKEDVCEEIDGAKISRAGCFAKVASQSLSLSYRKLLRRAVESFEPDVVVFHYPNPFVAHFLLPLLKKRQNCKLVLYWHLDITKQKLLSKFFLGQTKRLLERAVKIVATSPNYVEGSKFLSAYREKCTVIPNCVAAERATLTPAAVEIAQKIRRENEGKIVLFAVGRHVPYKGMEYLVRASKLLGKEYAVYIGGTGELTEELKALAADDEKVTFLGRVSDDELQAYMSACDVFCFPSITKNEAFGLALAEAMAFAKPAVTFTIAGSGVNYVSLDKVTGLETENGNVEKYAEAIRLLAENSALREEYGKNAKARVEENFTFEKFRERVKNLFAEVEKA